MTRAVFLGGGDDAKWIYQELEKARPDALILGMVGEKDWLLGKWGVVDFVRPADIRDVLRKLNKFGITSVAFFGKPVASISWKDLSPHTYKLLLQSIPYFSRSLPNVYFAFLLERLKSKDISTFNVGEIISHIQQPSGTTWGVPTDYDMFAAYERARTEMDGRRADWRKQGTLFLANGEVKTETSSTKKLIRNAGRDLHGAILVKSEVSVYKNLDTPVIEEELLHLCANNGIAGIITDASAIVIDSKNLCNLATRLGLFVHFI